MELLAVDPFDPDAHALEEPHHDGDVLDPGDVLEAALFVGQQGSGQDREDGILRTADRDPPNQPVSPLYEELRH